MSCMFVFLVLLVHTVSVAGQTITTTGTPGVQTDAPSFLSDSMFKQQILDSTNFYRDQHNGMERLTRELCQKMGVPLQFQIVGKYPPSHSLYRSPLLFHREVRVARTSPKASGTSQPQSTPGATNATHTTFAKGASARRRGTLPSWSGKVRKRWDVKEITVMGGMALLDGSLYVNTRR